MQARKIYVNCDKTVYPVIVL